MTKAKFFKWLKRTLPPRSIDLSPWYDHAEIRPRSNWYIHCTVAEFEARFRDTLFPMKPASTFLASSRSRESADRHVLKYERWLREFEEREAAEAAGGDDGVS